MQFELEVQKHYRPVHECKRVGCDNYIYGAVPVPTQIKGPLLEYECDECGETYTVRTKYWPKRDVKFVFS